MTSHFIYGPYTREASPTDRKPGCDTRSIFHLLRDRFGALIGGKVGERYHRKVDRAGAV